MAKDDTKNAFDIFNGFVEDPVDEYDKPSYTGSYGGGLYKKSLRTLAKDKERNAIRKEYPSLTDEQADELIEHRKRNRGMLEWSEGLQRAVMAEELKKSRPDLSDEQIQEKIDYQMAGSDLTFDDTPTLEELKNRFPGVSEESLKEAMTTPSEKWTDKTRKELFENTLRTEHPDWSEEKIRELVDMRDPEEGSEEEIDVPEIETEMTDLPPEDENEKKLEVNRPLKNDATIAEGGEEINPDDIQLDGEVEDPPEDETSVSSEEVGDFEEGGDFDNLANSLVNDNEPPNNPDATIAGKTLPEQKEPEQKAPSAEKKETKKTENKKEQTVQAEQKEQGEGSQYKHLPVGLRVTEDALEEANTIGGAAKDALQRIGRQGTNSGSIANEVSRAVPHFDYRSLFR